MAFLSMADGIGDLLDGPGGHHFDLALQEEDALRQLLDVHHLLDGRPLEQHGERPEALVVEVEVEVHVLVDGLEFVGDGRVEKGDALAAIHGSPFFRSVECSKCGRDR